jgi:hypothetical protein
LVKWENVCKPRKAGGLGVLNPRIHNSALIMENLYFMNEEHALGQNSGGVNLELKNNIHLMGMLEDGTMAGTHATQVSFKEVFILGY